MYPDLTWMFLYVTVFPFIGFVGAAEQEVVCEPYDHVLKCNMWLVQIVMFPRVSTGLFHGTIPIKALAILVWAGTENGPGYTLKKQGSTGW